MRLERRGRVKPLHSAFHWRQEETDECRKAVHHSQTAGVHAWKAVKANAGSAGVDKETIDDFEADLGNNLYRLWNRMSSGSYFPPPVKAVAIPKKNGGERILGVPTVADRVAQMVVTMTLEPAVAPIFLPDSYGYRPGKSALDAVAVTRTRCWKYDWVLEFDIKGLFDHTCRYPPQQPVGLGNWRIWISPAQS
jgi:RNA-directed DNA polymerase